MSGGENRSLLRASFACFRALLILLYLGMLGLQTQIKSSASDVDLGLYEPTGESLA